MNAPGAPTPSSAPVAAAPAPAPPAPSQTAPSTAAGSPPPEPPRTPAKERPGRLRGSFLAHEGGLMLLSLVLAVMVWYVVRDLVGEQKTLVVTVVPEAPPGHLAVAESKVTVHLSGKRGEIERAAQSVAKRGDTVVLKVAPIAHHATLERPFDGRDVYQWPFPARLIAGEVELPRGSVVRVSERLVAVREPELLGVEIASLRVRVELSQPSLTLKAPARAVGPEIVPDPVDVSAILRPGGGTITAPAHVTLTFERWKRAEDFPGDTFEQDRIVRRRAAVVLPEISATLRFEVAESASLPNSVEVVVKRGYTVREVTPAASASGFTGTVATGLTFVGKVTATREILKDLEERADDGWRWQLVVPASDLPADDEPKEVTARLLFIPFERFANLKAQGYIHFEPLNVPVQVARSR